MPRLLILILTVLTSLGTQARALESTPATSTHATVSLVSDTDAVSPGTPFRIGLRIRLAPGWHTYWRNPGDAGVAPELDLALPKGATAGPIGWPAPQRIAEGPVMTYAYTGEVLLPLTITPAPAVPTAATAAGTAPAAGTPAATAATPGDGAMTIAADARWLVCKQLYEVGQHLRPALRSDVSRPAAPPAAIWRKLELALVILDRRLATAARELGLTVLAASA